jgi:hypothetical protein
VREDGSELTGRREAQRALQDRILIAHLAQRRVTLTRQGPRNGAVMPSDSSGN